MASGQLPKGRGRGRRPTHEVGSSSDDVPPPPAIPKTTDVETSSITDDVQALVAPLATTNIGRGRPRRPVQKAEVEVEDPEWKVSDLSSDEFASKDRPSKPSEVGKTGEPITVMVNYFLIDKFPTEGFVYQYDIEIKNKNNRLIRRDHRRAVYYLWLKIFLGKYPEMNEHKIVFDDDKLIFTLDQQLPNIDEMGIAEKIIGPNRFDRLETYDVLIKQVGDRIDLSILRVLSDLFRTQNSDNVASTVLQHLQQALSIALHEKCSSLAEFISNRSFFSRPPATENYGSWNLGLGKAMWRGFYSCLIFTNGAHQLLMNLDVSYRVFMKEQHFLDFLCEVMHRSPSGERRYGRQSRIGSAEWQHVLEFLDPNINHRYYDDDIKFLLEHCANRSVRSQMPNGKRGYKIAGIGKSAERQTFLWSKTKAEITVKDYFKEQYGIELEYPTLPTLEMGRGAFLPMEVIYVEPVRMTRITDEQRAMLCLKSSLPPLQYSQSIQEIRENPNQQRFEGDPFVAAWNFNIYNDMLRIPARVLPMPDVICNEKSRVVHRKDTKRGVWNQSKTPFLKPTNFPPIWALINLSSSMNSEACKAFSDKLRQIASDRGIDCPAPVIYQEHDARTESREEIIYALRGMMIENDDCKFIFVILPENNPVRDQLYGDIKQLCELESDRGIVTQMMKLKKDEHTKPWNYSRLNNILLKINTKLDGINSTIAVPEDVESFFSRARRIMYVGVDLSHGPAGSNRRCSTVAVVASVDNIPIRYLKEIYIQERPPEADGESWETVVKMKDIMKSLILQYKTHHGYPPNAIIIYRDGISTSEFSTVFEKELTATRDACTELSVVYRPYLTYIVVNKRHHTRFFPTHSAGNIEAGTVIDSPNVTNPTTYDFFLNSHHVDENKGTSRPGHYHVLYDDNKLKPDQVQQLTYALCFLCARCSSSISIPAPVKYADLLAFRANFYRNANGNSSIESDDETSKIKSRRIILSPNLKIDSPFFI